MARTITDKGVAMLCDVQNLLVFIQNALSDREDICEPVRGGSSVAYMDGALLVFEMINATLDAVHGEIHEEA